MTTRNQLDGILASLRQTKEAAMKTAAAKTAADGSKPTSHPIGKAEDGTSAASTGARASENTSDSKAQNPLNPDSAGGPKATAPVAGSQGVDAKDATQAAADKPDTSGKSEMGSKDTAHPTKSAAELLSERIKAAKEGTPEVAAAADAKKDEKTVTADANTQKAPEPKAVDQKGHTDEKVAADKEAAEKFAGYCKELIEKHPDDFQAGVKFAQEVLEIVAAAAQQGASDGKTAGMDPAMAGGAMPPGAEGGMPPEGAPPMEGAAEGAEGAMPEGAEGGDQLDQLAAELEAAGVTPEELMQALQDTEQAGGDVPQQDEGEVAALQEAMQAEGMKPEDLAAAVGGEGGAPPAGADTGAEDAAGAAAAKAASDKHAALVEEFRAQIRTIKAAKAQAKK
jgi:hypothetical protein